MSTSPFKAYDLRGRVGEHLDEALMHRLGQAFATEIAEGAPVVVGYDARDSSPALAGALAEGLCAGGSDALELGLCGTEEVYFATDRAGAGGGLMVTGSHNPLGDNGVKLVRRGARPISRDTGLGRIEALVMDGDASRGQGGGRRRRLVCRDTYVARVTGFVDAPALPPARLLANSGNGAAGPVLDAVLDGLAAQGARLDVVRMHHDPDPSFPNGIPNPLLTENQAPTSAAVREAGADLGLAWDGDFDRCFFFDDRGDFIDGVYLVGLLAEAALAAEPGGTIVYDPRAVLNTRDIVARAGGRAVMGQTGHSLIKAVMRAENAVYGGEMSAHHYFRDFSHCDSGMIPWLLIAELVSRKGPLAPLVAARRAAHPSSGEINFRLDDPVAALSRVRAAFEPRAHGVDETDGLSLDMGAWRFNLRLSNTEPLLRLNVETRGGAVAPHVEAVRRALQS